MSFSAVVSGGSGKIGSQLINELTKRKINILSLDRNEKTDHDRITYLNVDLLDLTNLNEDIIDYWSKVNNHNDIIFFHLAWSGDEALTDGSLSDQLKNVEILSNSILIAKKTGCNKFFNFGTSEEFFVQENLKNWKNKPNSLKNYGLSKLTTHYYSQILTYLAKIDVVHIRFSAVVNSLSSEFTDNGFIHNNMVKLSNGKATDKILNNQLFDFIETNQLVNAILSIAPVANNKDEFYIGPNFPLKIQEFLDLIKIELVDGDHLNYLNKNTSDLYSCDKFFQKTGNKIYFNLKNFM